jgi:hypothetical protein
MTEEQIERQVEIRMNRLDRQLMTGGLSQNSYDMAVEDLDRWALAQYRERKYQAEEEPSL